MVEFACLPTYQKREISVKNKGKWQINGKTTDSSQTAVFLRTLSRKSNSNFVNNPDESMLQKAKYTLTIESKSIAPIIISAYENPSLVILNSSQNPHSFFNGTKNNYWHSIFVGKNHFFKRIKNKK